MNASKEITFLSGFKTYLVSAATIVTAVIAYLDGSQKFSTAITSVPGALLFLGTGLAALRSALAKIEAKLPASVDNAINAVVKKA